MSERQQTTRRTEAQGFPAGSSAPLQRECACSGSAGLDDQCEGCRQGKLIGQLTPTRPKLRIGPADDHYERQADRVADTVMRMPAVGAPGFSIERISPLVQRQPVEEEEEETAAQASPLQRQPVEEEEEETAAQASPLQRQPMDEEEELAQEKRVPGGGGAGNTRLTGIHRGGGQPLPATERTFFEPRLGFDFSPVRVHTGNRAAASAKSVGARAYTVGRDVVFGAGQWAPGTEPGRRLIAHELTHVVQQGSAPGAGVRIQRQPVGCTHAVTGIADRGRRPADELNQANQIALDWAQTALAQVEAVIAGRRVPMFIRSSIDHHFGRPNRRRLRLIRGAYRGIVRRLGRGTRIYRCRPVGANDCMRCSLPPVANRILACTSCPSSGHRTTVCPIFFRRGFNLRLRAMTCVHEAAHAAGACGDTAPSSANYPGRNPVNNSYSYEEFALVAGRTLGAPMPLRQHIPRAPVVRGVGGGGRP